MVIYLQMKMVHYVAIFFIIITFILTQEIGFTESHLNCKISTGPNPAQLPFLYVITDFGKGECRPRIELFTIFTNRFQ